MQNCSVSQAAQLAKRKNQNKDDDSHQQLLTENAVRVNILDTTGLV